MGTQPRGSWRNTSTATITRATTTLTIWLLPPTRSFTAVRESAPLMTKAWETPAPTLARPRAMNSRLASKA
ncbi:hypothetical protein D3C77_722460 [compost metagenome]